jgi:hypothetical protein
MIRIKGIFIYFCVAVQIKAVQSKDQFVKQGNCNLLLPQAVIVCASTYTI